MKRYLIVLLIAVVVLPLAGLVSCNQKQDSNTSIQESNTLIEDKASWSEKQVIDYLCEYLTDKAGQLQGLGGYVEKELIQWSFRTALGNATHEMMDEDDINKWGGLVTLNAGTMQRMSIQTTWWTGALKRLADYDEGGWWSVNIVGSGWRVNERTKEIMAWTDKATKLLEEITLKTYYNNKYGYYLDYPPSWSVNDKDMSKVWMYPSSSNAGEALIYINVIETAALSAFNGLQGYIIARLSLLQSTCYEFELTEVTNTEMYYNYRLQEFSPRNKAKRYFIQYGNQVYEIVCSGEITPFGEEQPLSFLFDPFDNFRFQP